MIIDPDATDPDDWPHRVEAYLRNEGLNNTEVINAGISGHASYQAFGRFFAEGHHLEPDYVLLYNSWNDIKRFSSGEFLLRDAKPYHEGKDPFKDYHNDLDEFLGQRSLLYIFLRYSYLSFKYRLGAEGSAQNQKGKIYTLNPLALDQFRLSLELFVDAARNIGAVPILMTQGRLIGQGDLVSEGYRLRGVENSMPLEFAEQAFVKADEIIRSVARAKGADLIDAAHMLVEQDKRLYFDHVHLEGEGSRQLSVMAGTRLKELILNSQ